MRSAKLHCCSHHCQPAPTPARTPADYYTQRPRGFAFLEFRDERDADEAIYQLDRTQVGGREITVCYSKEGRKTPREMMHIEGQGGGAGGGVGGGRGRGEQAPLSLRLRCGSFAPDPPVRQ